MKKSSRVPLTHYYAWGNNEKRAALKGRPCRIVARGRMNSALIEFEDGRREVVSRNALRRRPLSDGERVSVTPQLEHEECLDAILSFRRGWADAMAGRVKPVETLWDDLDENPNE